MRHLIFGLIATATTLSFAAEPTRKPVVSRGPDRSPILRSFDARMKPGDPFAIQQVINRRTYLKW